MTKQPPLLRLLFSLPAPPRPSEQRAPTVMHVQIYFTPANEHVRRTRHEYLQETLTWPHALWLYCHWQPPTLGWVHTLRWEESVQEFRANLCIKSTYRVPLNNALLLECKVYLASYSSEASGCGKPNTLRCVCLHSWPSILGKTNMIQSGGDLTCLSGLTTLFCIPVVAQRHPVRKHRVNISRWGPAESCLWTPTTKQSRLRHVNVLCWENWPAFFAAQLVVGLKGFSK